MDAPRPAEELPALDPPNAEVRVSDHAKQRPGMALDSCDPLDGECDYWICWINLPHTLRPLPW